MRIVQASEAKAKLLSLLDDVEKGETLVITRHGRAIARLVPDDGEIEKRRVEAFDMMSELRRRASPVSVEELNDMRREGRRY